MIEAIIQNHAPDFIFMSLPSAAEGGIQRAGRIKSDFPDITLVVMVSYDYPEYEAISKVSGVDHFISKENMDRQIIQRIVDEAKARC